MRDDRRIIAILPALNEAASLGEVLNRMPTWLDRVIVVDNGSTDNTSSVARWRGASVVREPKRGYGAACYAGVLHALESMQPDDVVVFLDADGSDDPREMARLVDPVLAGEADLVVGCRAGRERMPIHQRLGTQLVTLLLRIGFASKVTDLGPFRAIRWKNLLALGMRDRAYGWTAEMQARALRHGMRVNEVSVTWRRAEGGSKVSGTIGGSLRAGRDLTSKVVGQAIAMRFDSLGRKQLGSSSRVSKPSAPTAAGHARRR